MVDHSKTKNNPGFSNPKFCRRCGKVIGNNTVSSLTGWLFQEAFCQCDLKEGAGAASVTAGYLFDLDSAGMDVIDLPDLGAQYKVLERKGAGGTGTVYKVIEVKTERCLAIKVLHEELKNDRQAVLRFEQEAKACLALSHENLVSVFAYGVSPGDSPYLVMEFIEGVSLEQKLKEDTYLDVSSTVRILLQICAALSHAHQQGIVHRDLKPANIIISKNHEGIESAKLVDFGIAKVRAAAGRQTQNLTETGDVFGSPLYMSPEQCLGFDLDSRSDIYSLGCVMYECLSGKTPFTGHNAVQLIAKHLSAEIPQMRICDGSQSRRIEARLAEISSKCLEKEPQKRYYSVELLASDLRELTEEVQQSSTIKPFLNPKLSILRTSFVALCSASALSALSAFTPLSSPLLLLLPTFAAVSGIILLAQRISDIVSRTQFQSRGGRESAEEDLKLLAFGQSIVTVCAFFPSIILLFKHPSINYSIAASCLGIVVGGVVTTAYVQTDWQEQRRDSGTKVIAGKLVYGITFILLGVAASIAIAFNAATNLESQTLATDRIKQVSQDASQPKSAFSYERQLETDELISATDSLTGESSLTTISTIRVEGARKLRHFRFPTGTDLGAISSAGSLHSAKGEFDLPTLDHLWLTLTPFACANYAPVLKLFAGNEISHLRIANTSYNPSLLWTSGLDDVMYYISSWRGLEGLDLSESDLSDFGLLKMRRFAFLSDLDVRNTQVTTEGLIALPQLHELERLCISNLKGTGKIIKALHRSPDLVSFVAKNTDLDSADARELARFPNLDKIQIVGNKCFNDAAMKELSSKPSIKALDIQSCPVTAASLSYLLKLRQLEELVVSPEGWSNSQWTALQVGLPKYCRLIRHVRAN